MAQQVNKDAQINSFSKGMNMDTDIHYMPADTYRYAENIRIVTDDSGTNSVMQNSDGVEYLWELALTNPGEQIIHTATVRNYGIMFTIATDGLNRIYRLDFNYEYFETGFQVLVLEGLINIAEPVSSVTRWEDESNVKIYWADGVNSLRVISIVPELTYGDIDYYNNANVGDYIDITPGTALEPLVFEGFGSGSVKTGSYQYFFQLYNDFGSSTVVSQGTGFINLVPSEEGSARSQDYESANIDDSTGKSVILRLTSDILPLYAKVRLYAAYYASYGDTPIISVVNEQEIDGNSSIQLEDNGTFVLDEALPEQLSDLAPYQFVPKVIKDKDNILFAANIKEVTGSWELTDEEYDARAYRYDESGVAHIYDVEDGHIELLESDIIAGTQLVPFKHDCIPVETENNSNNNQGDLTEFQHTDVGGTYVLGGAGPNVSYEVVTLDLAEDELNTQVQPDYSSDWYNPFAGDYCNANDPKLESKIHSIDSLKLNRGFTKTVTDGNIRTYDSTSSEWVPITRNSGFVNYQNPFISEKFKSCKRDETYRYGVVFYNSKGFSSSVKWIADIKMPDNAEVPYSSFNTNVEIKEYDDNGNTSVKSLGYDAEDYNGLLTNGNVSCATHPLGLKFNIKNIPSNASAYEIVRVSREDDVNKSILLSAVMSNTYSNIEKSEKLDSLWYLNASGHDGFLNAEYGSHWSDASFFSLTEGFGKTYTEGYSTITSPEIVLSESDIANRIDTGRYDLKGSTMFTSKTIEPLEAPGRWDLSEWNGAVLSAARVMCEENTNRPVEKMVGTVQWGYFRDAGQPTGYKGPRSWSGYGDYIPRYHNILTGLKANKRTSNDHPGYRTATVAKYYQQYNNLNYIKSDTLWQYVELPWKADDLVGGIYPETGYDKITNLNIQLDRVKLAPNQDPNAIYNVDNNLSGVSIGTKEYTNGSYLIVTSGRDMELLDSPAKGAHGPCLITNFIDNQIKVGDNIPTRGPYKIQGEDEAAMSNMIIIVDVYKGSGGQYGGNTEGQRQYSVYSSCASYGVTDGSDIEVNSFGGDTYINMFDYAVNTRSYGGDLESYNPALDVTLNWSSDLRDLQGGLLHSAYIPMETSINTRLMYGSQISKLSKDSEIYDHTNLQLEVGVYEGYNQGDPMYISNSSHSVSESQVKSFLAKLDYTKSDKTFDCRIMNSEPKTNDEVDDSWTNFLVGNYIDVDTEHGGISALEKFKNRLFYWQEDAFGTVNVNERSLIKDDNASQLLLGTGGTLTRYDYISTTNGIKEGASGNIVISEKGLYWYDHLRKELISYSGGVGSLGKIKGVQSYLNLDTVDRLDRLTSVYDKKYNEVIFTFRNQEYDR